MHQNGTQNIHSVPKMPLELKGRKGRELIFRQVHAGRWKCAKQAASRSISPHLRSPAKTSEGLLCFYVTEQLV